MFHFYPIGEVFSVIYLNSFQVVSIERYQEGCRIVMSNGDRFESKEDSFELNNRITKILKGEG